VQKKKKEKKKKKAQQPTPTNPIASLQSIIVHGKMNGK
jgi:hypothetical protein